jgi:hypothetical protein
MNSREILDPQRKALKVNLDPRRYGTFAEIGAGQEVVRWFFRAGAAAGTIAKSISAYDMTVSDAIYGKADRYVTRQRLAQMLDHEYNLNIQRLKEKRGDNTAFFAFADTVATQSFRGNSECHGWMGVRFQAHPRDEVSQIVIHVRMWDKDAAAQSEALGIVGVNLLYGAFFHHHEPEVLIESLLDGLSISRIEVDMIEFNGIEFRHVDNRLMSLKLVSLGLTDAAMFGPDGEVMQPSEVFYKKNVIVERGSFRPVCRVHLDMMDSAREVFLATTDVDECETLEIVEMTMKNLLEEGAIDGRDFLARADMLGACGKTVLVSNFAQYFRLAAYLARYTKKKLAVVLGGHSLVELFDEKYYTELPGGILEAFGRLYKNDLHIYAYPWQDGETVRNVDNLPISEDLQKLYGYLLDRKLIVPVIPKDNTCLAIRASEVLVKIRKQDNSWEKDVPSEVAAVIRSRGLFGYPRQD